MEAGSFGCTRRTSRDNGKSLDSSIDISEKNKCAQLCLQQEGSGCCELNRDIGCYWREGESANGIDSGSGTAVTCSFVQGCFNRHTIAIAQIKYHKFNFSMSTLFCFYPFYCRHS